MTTFSWMCTEIGTVWYACARRMFPYGRITYRFNDSGLGTYTAMIQMRAAQAVSLGTFDTDPEARAAIEAMIPLYLSETDL